MGYEQESGQVYVSCFGAGGLLCFSAPRSSASLRAVFHVALDIKCAYGWLKEGLGSGFHDRYVTKVQSAFIIVHALYNHRLVCAESIFE